MKSRNNNQSNTNNDLLVIDRSTDDTTVDSVEFVNSTR